MYKQIVIKFSYKAGKMAYKLHLKSLEDSIKIMNTADELRKAELELKNLLAVIHEKQYVVKQREWKENGGKVS